MSMRTKYLPVSYPRRRYDTAFSWCTSWHVEQITSPETLSGRSFGRRRSVAFTTGWWELSAAEWHPRHRSTGGFDSPARTSFGGVSPFRGTLTWHSAQSRSRWGFRRIPCPSTLPEEASFPGGERTLSPAGVPTGARNRAAASSTGRICGYVRLIESEVYYPLNRI